MEESTKKVRIVYIPSTLQTVCTHCVKEGLFNQVSVASQCLHCGNHRMCMQVHPQSSH